MMEFQYASTLTTTATVKLMQKFVKVLTLTEARAWKDKKWNNSQFIPLTQVS